MRIVEGTVDEVVEYQQRMALLSAAGVSASESTPAAEAVPDGNEPAVARAATGGDWTPEDEFFIKQFVYGRATGGPAAKRVLRYLRRMASLGTTIEAGESERSRDGWTDYLMVRDDGPPRFGAVAYVKPGPASLTLRLRPEDVADLSDERIKPRDVIPTQMYAINCPLADDEAVDLAVALTERALRLVRKV